MTDTSRDSACVFVVYGRDRPARGAMFDFLRSLSLRPLEWSQAVALTASAAPFVGDVLTTAFEAAQAVVVLMTPDDVAQLQPHLIADDDPDYEKQPTGQPRPNVLFEAGMALGLHPERTVIVEFGKLRPFSDIGGRHVVRFDGSAAARQALSVRLEAAGCDVDRKGTDWLSAGTFEAFQADLANHHSSSPTTEVRRAPYDSTAAPSEPKLLVKVSRSSESRYRFVVTNRGPGSVRELLVTLADDAAILLFDDDMPVVELPEGESLTIPAVAVRPITRGQTFVVGLYAKLESGKEFEKTLSCRVL